MSTNTGNATSNPRGLDHLVIAVSDLDAAMARYQRFGFTTTPRARHPWGTGNSLVQYGRSFLELLSIEDIEGISASTDDVFSFGDFGRQFLEHHQGMSMLVFSSDDAAADLAVWRAAGLKTYAPFDFSRSATLPDGKEVTVAFSLAFVAHPEMPWARWFVCQQRYPENFWKPQYQTHANGARGLRTIVMAASEPQRFEDFFARLFDDGRVTQEDGGFRYALPDGDILMLPPEQAEQRVPGAAAAALTGEPRFIAALVDADVDATASILDANSVQFERRHGELWVAAQRNEGLALGFSGQR